MDNANQDKKKGSGKSLKERMVGTELMTAQKEQDQKTPTGHVFEESTQTISTMTKDVQEAAQIVSRMKTVLEEKRSKIADLIAIGNPLSDPFGRRTNTDSSTEMHRINAPEQKTTMDDQKPHFNQPYEMISKKLDAIIEQNNKIIQLLNKSSENKTAIP
jgi:hypothetical protein